MDKCLFMCTIRQKREKISRKLVQAVLVGLSKPGTATPAEQVHYHRPSRCKVRVT